MAPFFQRVTLPTAESPSRWVFLLHGILGQGGNLRTVARRWLSHLPDTGAVLIDLRNHGRSRHLPPPDDLDACAADLERVIAAMQTTPHAVLGHSFGGKVALHYAARLRARGEPVRQVWVLDSVIGARAVDARDAGPGSTEAIVSVLENLPTSFPTREAFNAHLEAAGLPPAIVAWLAMNVTRDGADGDCRFGPDMMRVRAMLDSYFATDLWPALAEHPAECTHIVIAERGSAFDAEARARLQKIADASAGAVRAEHIDAGHWLHVDAPDALDALLARG